MNIGFDAKRLFYNHTGLGNYSRTLVQNLQLYYPQHNYHLFTPEPTPKILTQYPSFNRERFFFHTNKHLPKAMWRSWRMAKEWDEAQLSIFHGLSNELPFASANAKTVITIHDLIFKRLPNTYSFINRSIYDKKVRISCQRADKIVAISESTKRDLIYYYQIDPQKIAVIYQAVNSLFYEKLELPERNLKQKETVPQLPKEYILSVGTLQSRKNQLSILQAWQLLPKPLQMPIVLVGQGAIYKKQLERYAAKHQIRPIYWLDKVTSNEDLKAIYKKAELFIYPSLYEGFGLPVVEALLCGIPVITSNISSLPEAAGPHSSMIDPRNIEEIAAAMENILNDAALRQGMVEQGLRFANNQFNPQKLSKNLMSLYQYIAP